MRGFHRMIHRKYGFSVSFGGARFCLFFGDLYIRVPKCFELAWNCTGFYFCKGGA